MGETREPVATVERITRTDGVAGQVIVTTWVRYARSDTPSRVSFVGSAYGSPGPVAMILDSGAQCFVSEPERFGETFGEAWARRFWE